MILDISKITWDKSQNKGDRIAVSSDKKLEAWKLPGEGIFVVERKRSKHGQRVLAGPLKALMMLCLLLLLPSLAGAAGAGGGNYGKSLELGGGYYIPNLPDGQQFTAGSFNNHVGASFDCGNIDWAAQFQQQLNLNLSQEDIKNLGTAAIAGSAKYIAASMMPTWFETIQTALSQAQGIIKVAHSDCNSVAQSLQAADPIGKMRRRLKAKKTKEAADKGTTFDEALSEASQAEFHFDFARDIAGSISKDNPEAAALMVGFLGDLSIDIGGNGSRRVAGSNPAPQMVDGAFGYLSNVIAPPVLDTLTTGKNCDKPFHLTSDQAKAIVAQIKAQQKAKAAAAPPAKGKKKKGGGLTKTQQADLAKVSARISNISDYALSKVDGRHYRGLGCDSIQYYRSVGTGENEYQIIAELMANNMAVDGLKSAIEDLRNQIAMLNLTSKDGNGQQIKDLMQDRITAIQMRMHEKQREVEREKEIARSVLKLRNARQVELTAARSRARQRAGLNQAVLTQSPQDFAAGF